jgi:hypothetical protein
LQNVLSPSFNIILLWVGTTGILFILYKYYTILVILTPCIMHLLLFCTMTNQCTINHWPTNVIYIYGAPCKARNVNVVYIYMDLHLATLKAISFYLLHNFSTLNECRKCSCVTVVCKHFASYQGYPKYKWDLIW